MYNKKYVIPFIIIFVVGFFMPVWYNAMAGTLGYAPKLQLPSGSCIENAHWMAANHMLLLKDWRNHAVRQGEVIYHSSNGKTYYTAIYTCWECHKSRKEFCDKCHNYLGVRPECWDCHWTPSVTLPVYKGVKSMKSYLYEYYHMNISFLKQNTTS